MFKLITPLSQIDKEARTAVAQQEILCANELCKIGAQCVEIAKSLPQNGSRAGYPMPYTPLEPHQENYVDWTQNLRKSIGWAVVKDGKVYRVDLGPIGNTRILFEEIKKDYSTGITLLVMATGKDPEKGRAYAYYVQALDYDVLKTSQLRGEYLAKQTLQKLFSNARN